MKHWVSGFPFVEIPIRRSPAIVSCSAIPDAANDIVIAGRLVYVSDTYVAPCVIDVTDPATPAPHASASLIHVGQAGIRAASALWSGVQMPLR